MPFNLSYLLALLILLTGLPTQAQFFADDGYQDRYDLLFGDTEAASRLAYPEGYEEQSLLLDNASADSLFVLLDDQTECWIGPRECLEVYPIAQGEHTLFCRSDGTILWDTTFRFEPGEFEWVEEGSGSFVCRPITKLVLNVGRGKYVRMPLVFNREGRYQNEVPNMDYFLPEALAMTYQHSDLINFIEPVPPRIVTSAAWRVEDKLYRYEDFMIAMMGNDDAPGELERTQLYNALGDLINAVAADPDAHTTDVVNNIARISDLLQFSGYHTNGPHQLLMSFCEESDFEGASRAAYVRYIEAFDQYGDLVKQLEAGTAPTGFPINFNPISYRCVFIDPATGEQVLKYRGTSVNGQRTGLCECYRHPLICPKRDWQRNYADSIITKERTKVYHRTKQSRKAEQWFQSDSLIWLQEWNAKGNLIREEQKAGTWFFHDTTLTFSADLTQYFGPEGEEITHRRYRRQKEYDKEMSRADNSVWRAVLTLSWHFEWVVYSFTLLMLLLWVSIFRRFRRKKRRLWFPITLLLILAVGAPVMYLVMLNAGGEPFDAMAELGIYIGSSLLLSWIVMWRA